MGMIDAFNSAIGGIDSMARTRMAGQEQGFSQQLRNQMLGLQEREQQARDQEAQQRAEKWDQDFTQHLIENGASPVHSGLVKRMLAAPGMPASTIMDKADPSRVITHKTTGGEALQFELPTAEEQIRRQNMLGRQQKAGEQETADFIRNKYGKMFTPEDTARYHLPDVLAQTPLMAGERVQVAQHLPTMEQAGVTLDSKKRELGIQELSGLVDPTTGQVSDRAAYDALRAKYPGLQLAAVPINGQISQVLTSGVPIEKQPEYLQVRNLYKMRPEDFDARVDALKLPPELAGRTKQLVQQAIQLGDRKGALSVIKDASDQMGRTETALRTAEATKPIKIDLAAATTAARAPKVGDDALDVMAWDAINGKEPSSRNPVLYAKVKARQAEILRSQGMDAQAGIVERNAAKANNEAFQALNKQYALLKPFAEMADKNADLLEKRMNAVSDLGAPILNSPIRTVQYKFTGNANVAALRAALLPVQADFARILSSPDAKGVLSDHARKEMEGAIGGDATVGQVKAALDVFRQDAKARKDSYEANLADLKRHSVVGGSNGQVAQPNTPKATHRFNPATGKIEVIQ